MRKFSLVFIVLLAAAASVLAQSGGIKGRVRTASGKAIPGASIAVRQDGEDLKSTTADDEGKFSVEGLAAGTYVVVLNSKGYAMKILHKVEVKKGNTRDLGERLIMTTDQGTIILIKGSVFYKEGTSLAGAKVELAKVNADGSTEKIASTTSTYTGEFTFRRPEGAAKYRVTAKFDDVSASKDVEVDMAAIYRLAISLDVTRAQK